MAKGKNSNVTMRVRVGESEIEVTGPSSFVEKKIAEFLNKPPAHSRRDALPSYTPQSLPPQGKAKPKSPAQFFKAANPKTDTDRVLIGAYFLEKFREAQNATAAEVKELIKEAKRQPPANTNDAINQNIRKGFLMTAGDRESKMTFVLTSDGEEQVEEMLNKPTG